jgi:hypothetical protein
MGQAGGPEDAGASTLVKLDGDGEFGLRDAGVGRSLVELRRIGARLPMEKLGGWLTGTL